MNFTKKQRSGGVQNNNCYVASFGNVLCISAYNIPQANAYLSIHSVVKKLLRLFLSALISGVETEN